MHHDLSFYDQYPTGKIVSRVTADTQAFSEVVTLSMEVVSQTVLVLLIFVYLATVDPVLTLITLALVPLVAGVALAFRRIARDVVTQSRRAVAEVSAHVHETVSGIGIAKSFRKEQTLYDQFADVNRRSFRLNWRAGVVFASIFPVLFLIAGIGNATLAYTGGVRAAGGGLTTGEWYLFLQAVGLMWFPLTSIASFWSQFQLGMAAGERVFALLDAEPQVAQTGSQRVPALAGAIELRNVSFHYKQGEPVFDDFSLSVAPGETVALVGHTGSGKSSITKLVARFYEYQKGEILVDGHDIRSLDLAGFRTQLGFVTQVPFLFNGSVLDKHPLRAQRRRRRRSDRRGAPCGRRRLDRHVTGWADHGGGGARAQPVAGPAPAHRLARVVLQEPAIIILDEATASVDPFTEALIQEGLDELLHDRTAMVIAHRLSTSSRPTASSCCAPDASSRKAPTSACSMPAATTPSCTTPTSATRAWNTCRPPAPDRNRGNRYRPKPPPWGVALGPSRPSLRSLSQSDRLLSLHAGVGGIEQGRPGVTVTGKGSFMYSTCRRLPGAACSGGR